VLVQSMAILEYLDERFPDPPLLPLDPAGRARVRALAEHVNSAIQPLQNSAVLRFLGGKKEGLDRDFARHFNEERLLALEAALSDGGAGRFCHGDVPGLADCYLVPQLYAARRFAVDLAPFPSLRRRGGLRGVARLPGGPRPPPAGHAGGPEGAMSRPSPSLSIRRIEARLFARRFGKRAG